MPYKTKSGKWKWANIERDTKSDLVKTMAFGKRTVQMEVFLSFGMERIRVNLKRTKQ